MFKTPKLPQGTDYEQINLDNLFFEDYLLGASDGSAPKPKPPVLIPAQRTIVSSVLVNPMASVDHGVMQPMAGTPVGAPNLIPKIEDEEAKDEESRKRKLAPDLKARQERTKQRNRVHAKKTRLRKKFYLASLQKELELLKKQTEALKSVIVQNFSEEKSKELLGQCCSDTINQDHEELFGSGEGSYQSTTGSPMTEHSPSSSSSAMVPAMRGKPPTELDVNDSSLLMNLLRARLNFCIADAKAPDCPLIYCSKGFCDLTGYTSEECLGRNCRFLQGPDTDASAVSKIRAGVAEGRDTGACILNYRKDGTTFWNNFFVAALYDKDREVVNYVGVQCEVPQQLLSQENQDAFVAPSIFKAAGSGGGTGSSNGSYGHGTRSTDNQEPPAPAFQ